MKNGISFINQQINQETKQLFAQIIINNFIQPLTI